VSTSLPWSIGIAAADITDFSKGFGLNRRA
jgi:hypothetical protein